MLRPGCFNWLDEEFTFAPIDDRHLWQSAGNGARERLLDPDSLVRHAALEDLIEHAYRQPALVEWAGEFRRRYLDLSPVLAAL